MKKHLYKLTKSITTFLIVSVFILTIEVAARIDDKLKYNAPFFGHYSSQVLRAKDSEGITHNIPNSRFEKWDINNLGFRGADLTLQKSKNVVRIVCMGTSETFGLYESPDKEWPAQLMNFMKNYHRFQVINTSVVGLPLTKFSSYIEKYVLKLQPDIIILYINPFSYAAGVHTFENRQELPAKTDGKMGKWFSLKKIKDNFRIIAKIKLALKKVLPVQIIKWKRLLSLKEQLSVLEKKRLKNKKPLDAVPDEYIDRFRDDLYELVQFLQCRKVEAVLCTYPVLISPKNIDMHLDIFLDHRRFYIELSLLGIIDASVKFNEAIKNVATESEILLIDNSEVIPKNIQYFADNVHYTDDGARLVAENIFYRLKESLLPHSLNSESREDNIAF